MRADIISRFERQNTTAWDFVIIGGGATGIGTAIEAAARGHKTLLLEQSDFAKSTSSKSTKLVHGGVRYLAQGYVDLVREACRERGLLLNNAPHLTRNLSFVIPIYTWFDMVMYFVGLKFYDMLAGRLSLGKSKYISKSETIRRLPTVKKDLLIGGILYHDGQFDDARLALNMAQTAIEQGATVLNYAKVTALRKDDTGKLNGLSFIDEPTGHTYQIKATAIINATGVFADDINRMDHGTNKKTISPSQGVHIMVDKKFCPTDSAIMIPKTADGRVLFAVPWHEKIILGTTDTPVKKESLEPVASEAEIDFILETARGYINPAPTRKDIISVFTGLRPLAATKEGTKTKEVSRSHKVITSPSNLISIIGGKWTTYRKMAEDTVNQAEVLWNMTPTTTATKRLQIHGYKTDVDFRDPMYFYGSDKDKILQLGNEIQGGNDYLSELLAITKAQVIWAVRQEMALTIEDVLSRRTRALLLNREEAVRIAPQIASIMAQVLGTDKKWEENEVAHFEILASLYSSKPPEKKHNTKAEIVL